MDLVVGSTGILGSEICRRLRQRGRVVRALVRQTSDPAKVAALEKVECEIVRGDLQDRKSLDRACAGAESVISTASTTISRQAHDSLVKTDQEGQFSLIDAAIAARVKRFVLVSFSGNLEGDSALHRAKRAVEQRLKQSGLTYTILRPSCFMEVWLSPMLGFDPANRKAQIFGGGQKPVSFISLFDVAEFAVQTLLSGDAANQTIELGGPEPIAPRKVVGIFEDAVGGKIEVTDVPEAALRQQHAAATEEYQKTFAALMLGICGGDSIDMTETLRRFPVKMTSVRDYARNITSGR